MIKHAIAAFLLSTGAAMAHSGHEAAVVQGEAHWLMQADHLVVLALGVLAAGLVARKAVRARRHAVVTGRRS